MPVFRRNTVILLALLAAASISIHAYGQSEETPGQNATATHNVADLRSELEQLKKLVLQQQERINALELKNRQSAEPAASQSSQEQPQSQGEHAGETSAAGIGRSDQNSGSSDERIRNLERQIKGIGPISFSGDVRLRGEPFFGGPADESLERARARFRARFNAVADLGEQFRAGITLASGEINDPTSTNQTLTGFYARKPIGIDLAFVEYKPKWFKHLDLVGGKFRYPWYNTELTWDKDINPEGAAQVLTFQPGTPILKRIAVIGFELPLAEVAGTQATDKRIAQNTTYGGQLQTTWQIAPRVQLSAYSGFYDYRGADSIALALAKSNNKNPQTPLVGLLPLGAGNPVQNSMFVTTGSTIITIGANKFPTGVPTVSNAQFASRFGLSDNIARFDIRTGSARLPLSLIGDYVQNTEACANLAKLVPAPLSTSTMTFAQSSNFSCNPHARRGYWLEARLGRLQGKGDWQVGYTRMYIEREAVLSNFSYSEMRQGGNVTQHRWETFYQLEPSVQLGFVVLMGRPLASTEHYLTRLQFDAAYIF